MRGRGVARGGGEEDDGVIRRGSLETSRRLSGLHLASTVQRSGGNTYFGIGKLR